MNFFSKLYNKLSAITIVTTIIMITIAIIYMQLENEIKNSKYYKMQITNLKNNCKNYKSYR
jgi:hypothetical protein